MVKFEDSYLKCKLDTMKDRIQRGLKDPSIMRIIFELKEDVKGFFPINKVPEKVVDYLDLVQDRFEIAEDTLQLVIDTIIEEVKKVDDLE